MAPCKHRFLAVGHFDDPLNVLSHVEPEHGFEIITISRENFHIRIEWLILDHEYGIGELFIIECDLMRRSNGRGPRIDYHSIMLITTCHLNDIMITQSLD